MRYLVQAKLKESNASELFEETRTGTLGTGSVAFGEYIKNMEQARILDNGSVCWIEVCFCPTPLNEERKYWEKYFDDLKVEDAHNPNDCLDKNGAMKRACFHCSCTEEIEGKIMNEGQSFITWAQAKFGLCDPDQH